MAVCPTCKREVARRKNGGCPYCGQELQMYDGYYYRADLGSPTKALLGHFEELVSAQSSKRQGMPIVFHISSKTAQYKRELVEAQRLLAICDGDSEVAFTTLEVLFNNPQFSFKTRSSLLGIQRDFVLAMAVAKAMIAKQQRIEDVQQQAVEAVMQREDIWS